MAFTVEILKFCSVPHKRKHKYFIHNLLGLFRSGCSEVDSAAEGSFQGIHFFSWMRQLQELLYQKHCAEPQSNTTCCRWGCLSTPSTLFHISNGIWILLPAKAWRIETLKNGLSHLVGDAPSLTARGSKALRLTVMFSSAGLRSCLGCSLTSNKQG